jgi:hypothetical protein
MNRARNEGESWEDYRNNLKWWEKGLRMYRRGWPIWTARQGTYEFDKHGKIGIRKDEHN